MRRSTQVSLTFALISAVRMTFAHFATSVSMRAAKTYDECPGGELQVC